MSWLAILLPCAILGLCLFGIGLMIWRIIRSRQRTVHTTGVVVRFTSNKWFPGPHHPHVEFVDRDGNRREFRSQWGAGGTPWPVGKQVKVSYDPADPDDAELAFSETRLALVLALIVLGTGVAVTGFEVIKDWRWSIAHPPMSTTTRTPP